MNGKKKITAVGVNPAWQKVLQFGQLHYNAVNRADNMWSFASGKGVNFVRAAGIWGRAEAELVQFAGGDNGKLLLDDLAREKLSCKTFAGDSPTRCCTTLLSYADSAMTEIIEPSQAPGKAAAAAALEYIAEAVKQSNAVALCGQLPSGMDIDFYVKCAGFAAAEDKFVLVDFYKNAADVLPVLKRGVLKINADELRALTGVDDVPEAMKMLLKNYSFDYVAITDGAARAFFADRRNVYVYNVPQIEKVVNPVGSGDTASAVLLSCLLAGEAPENAFAYAIAAASANCLSMKCGEFDRSTAEKLFENINITLY